MKNKNSLYSKITAWMRNKRIYTKAQVIEQCKKFGLSDMAALASAAIILSPRANRGSGIHWYWHKVSSNGRKFRFMYQKCP